MFPCTYVYGDENKDIDWLYIFTPSLPITIIVVSSIFARGQTYLCDKNIFSIQVRSHLWWIG